MGSTPAVHCGVGGGPGYTGRSQPCCRKDRDEETCAVPGGLPRRVGTPAPGGGRVPQNKDPHRRHDGDEPDGAGERRCGRDLAERHEDGHRLEGHRLHHRPRQGRGVPREPSRPLIRRDLPAVRLVKGPASRGGRDGPDDADVSDRHAHDRNEEVRHLGLHGLRRRPHRGRDEDEHADLGVDQGALRLRRLYLEDAPRPRRGPAPGERGIGRRIREDQGLPESPPRPRAT